jgi:hypothetical protein
VVYISGLYKMMPRCVRPARQTGARCTRGSQASSAACLTSPSETAKHEGVYTASGCPFCPFVLFVLVECPHYVDFVVFMVYPAASPFPAPISARRVSVQYSGCPCV